MGERKMQLKEDDVKALTDLGLSPRQASVFLVLSRLKSSNARTIATASRQARQDVYKVLDELLQLGLIEKELSTPTKFTTIPIHDACSILLRRKVRNAAYLRRETKVLERNIQAIDVEPVHDEDRNMLLVSEGETIVLRMKKSIENTRKSIDAIAPQKFLGQGFFFLTEALEKALQRGVKIRFITCISDETDSQFSVPSALTKKSSFKIRTTLNHTRSRFCVYDNKEVTVVLSSDIDFTKSSLLWSNCASLVDGYQDYYETLWNDSIDFSRLKRKTETALSINS
jgi:sugar-specific transcriptional regulator TrmB